MKIKQTLPFAALAAALFLSACSSLTPPPSATATATAPRTRELFDTDWRFIRGDAPDQNIKLSYSAAKPWLLPAGNPFTTNPPAARPEGNFGGNVSFAQPGFDDSGWRQLNLPHDFGIEGPFDQALSGSTGKLPWFGVAWYRKHLEVPATDTGRKIYLDVDGAMSYAEVWLNGKFVGGWPYGYASWRVDLTPFVQFGGDNVIAIRLDNPPDSSRWYPGGGIYRNVWLVETGPVHVAQWGTYVTTPVINADAAQVVVATKIENETTQDQVLSAETKIYKLDDRGAKTGEAINSQSTQVSVAAGASQAGRVELVVPHPKLWSLEQPSRYVAVTTVRGGGKIRDVVETPFGIRSIQFTADNGFLLNGQRVPIHGVCNHSDLGALGSAINVRGLERQIEILKQFGCNAIRTSHNPPSPELLDLCDRLGMLVMDESFDCWEHGKTKNDYSRLFDDWHEKDWRAELRRDRNHPSIILWSIGNEVGEQNTRSKFWIGAELTRIAHEEDPTRPTTSANSDVKAGYNGFLTNEDVFGYNYKPFEYSRVHATNPLTPLFGSETASCISSRGEYFFPVSDNKAAGAADFQMSSYDLYAPTWATTPAAEFKGEEQNPFIAGEFVWTGFDYLGEPTPYDRNETNVLNFTDPARQAAMRQEFHDQGKVPMPSRSSYFGIVDLAGFPKDRFYLYQAHWRPDFPMAHILPHWTWPGREGQVTPVHVYTSGDEAELFLNGQSLGRKKKGQFEYRLRWDDVKYAPGELKVVAYKNGRPWATDVVQTAGPAAKLTLAADRAVIAADGRDLSYVTVTVADAAGRLVPRANNHIQFALAGPGEIVAVDNGDATSHEPFQAREHNAYNGLALVIVRATQPGKLTLTAQADGLQAGTTQLIAQP